MSNKTNATYHPYRNAEDSLRAGLLMDQADQMESLASISSYTATEEIMETQLRVAQMFRECASSLANLEQP